jgi:hypothetical protein
MRLVARTGHPDFLDLPWDEPLEGWRSERLVEVARGISRHVVRFVEYDGVVYAVKEIGERLARREYGLLLRLAREAVPVVDAVGVVSGRRTDPDAALITRHLDFSLPYRALFSGRPMPDLRRSLLDGLAQLLVRLHLAGFFWGDCSLSNTLFRRDAGSLSAYLVDAETGEHHPTLTDGQRLHDIAIAEENLVGELFDVCAESRLPAGFDPVDVASALVESYERLWLDLTQEEVFAQTERYKIEDRLHRLNELGFDVEEIELDAGPDGYRLRLDPHVVEPGHHGRRLFALTGLHAQENQARRLLNDLASFRAQLEEKEGKPVPESVAAYRWRAEVFEPAVSAVPDDLSNKLPAAEVFHELLDHRWYLSEQAGKDIGLNKAVDSYVSTVLRHAPDERTVLQPGRLDADDEDAA